MKPFGVYFIGFFAIIACVLSYGTLGSSPRRHKDSHNEYSPVAQR